MKFYFLYALDLYITLVEEHIESNEPKMVSFKKTKFTNSFFCSNIKLQFTICKFALI